MTTAIALTNEQALAEYDKMLQEQAAGIANRIGKPSGNTISTKGKQFKLPDGTISAGPMRAIVLDWVSYNAHYDGAYDPNKPKPPTCFALGDLETLTPSANAPNRQSDKCAGCPKNEWQSAATGRGKACKNQYRLAIIPENLGAPDVKGMYTLTVSPTGMKAFEAFVRTASKDLGALPIRCAVDIGFNQAEAYPTLTFGNASIHNNLAIAMQLQNKAREMLTREPEADGD